MHLRRHDAMRRSLKGRNTFTFDPRKNERNLRERGLSFEMVEEFDFGSAIYSIDTRKDYGEVRTRALGFIGDSLYALVFTKRNGALRVSV